MDDFALLFWMLLLAGIGAVLWLLGGWWAVGVGAAVGALVAIGGDPRR